jgi:hypothetical protein
MPSSTGRFKEPEPLDTDATGEDHHGHHRSVEAQPLVMPPLHGDSGWTGWAAELTKHTRIADVEALDPEGIEDHRSQSIRVNTGDRRIPSHGERDFGLNSGRVAG